jgi:hypothetical protein
MSDEIRDQIRNALEYACRCQSLPAIRRGRTEILSLPRAIVLEVIESVAAEKLPLSEEWEYRRLLELYRELDTGLLQRLVASGLVSADADIREAAEDFSKP